MTPPLLPSLEADAWRLVAGVASVLVVASSIGALLARTLARAPADSQARPLIDNLNQRIKAWWIIAGSVGLALLGGSGGVALLFALASLQALREFLPVAADRPTRLRQWGVVAAFVPLQYFLAWRGEAAFTLLIPLAVALGTPLLGVLSGDAPRFLRRHGNLAGGLLICVFAISHLPALLTLRLPGYDKSAAYLLVFLLIVVQASDVLQYLWGKLAGRHPIAPRVSPAKTVDGTIGGLLSASALGAGLSAITPFSPAQALAIALLLTALGFAGGLALSAVKRHRGIKDWGRLLPGHGGVLDRLDSLYLSAPAFYYLLRHAWGSG